MRGVHIVVLSCLAIGVASLPIARAHADPATWLATSKTAMAITGDIVLDDYSLTFKNGKALDLEPYDMEKEGDWSGSGNVISGDVFRIDPPANPKLLRGNSLCASPVTWLVQWRPGEGELTVNLYTAKRAPSGVSDADGLCATYGYETP